MERDELDACLKKLRADLPRLLAGLNDEDDFWPAFAGEADVIEDCVTNADDCRYVREQLSKMLEDASVSGRL